jgi:hypothetical protein
MAPGDAIRTNQTRLHLQLTYIPHIVPEPVAADYLDGIVADLDGVSSSAMSGGSRIFRMGMS